MWPSECHCAECLGIVEPPTEPGPCGAPNPDAPGEKCGDYEDHDGEHGYWYTPQVGQVPDGD
ncbi:hypothetical protein [Sphaerimonospora thailandensis]|uniref:Uncharacterized protein n=1 Tax=Sphaerimonospora thailandensis TaxID=795644 RepID=A0A8J3VZ35_9ACTN|nr:hypothetical protein [Sphaerimonospora thailandensis]GIH69481.1 hypothetical protein Mth01_17340 [Sphaerimonospora thailandensis]